MAFSRPPPPPPLVGPRWIVEHLSASGLRVTWPDGAALSFDPPRATPGPLVVTWSENERVAGVKAGAPGPVAAHATLLDWLDRHGVPLTPGIPTPLGPFLITAHAYRPIPWATPTEAVRKTLSGLGSPALALTRLRHTLRRPKDPPLVIVAEHAGRRFVHLGQALHRFLPEPDAVRLTTLAADAHLVVAGTDYDDEADVGRLLHRCGSGPLVVADLVGQVRRRLGLPTRPLSATVDAAPPGTRGLDVGGTLELLTGRSV